MCDEMLMMQIDSASSPCQSAITRNRHSRTKTVFSPATLNSVLITKRLSAKMSPSAASKPPHIVAQIVDFVSNHFVTLCSTEQRPGRKVSRHCQTQHSNSVRGAGIRQTPTKRVLLRRQNPVHEQKTSRQLVLGGSSLPSPVGRSWPIGYCG